MTTSLADLQAQLDALRQLCPKLLPAVVPHGYDTEDLWGLVQTEGKAAKDAFKAYLASAAKAHNARGSGCCVCGVDGEATAQSAATDDEARTLRFTVFPEASFSDRTLSLSKAGWACGLCRAMRDPQRFTAFAATRLSAAKPEREALALELCQHMVAVNGVDEGVAGNTDALVLWVQEVVARAYALCVVASGVSGWKVVGPPGSSGKAGSSIDVRQGVAGTALKLAQALLQPPAKSAAAPAANGSHGSKAGSKSGKAADAGVPGKGKCEKSKQLGKRAAAEEEEQAAPKATPGPKSKAAPVAATPVTGKKTPGGKQAASAGAQAGGQSAKRPRQDQAQTPGTAKKQQVVQAKQAGSVGKSAKKGK